MRYQIGKFYRVPCVQTMRGLGFLRLPWVPVLGAAHVDEDLGIHEPHFHIDWRFMPDAAVKAASYGRPAGYELGRLVFVAHVMQRAERLRLCKREMPEFPIVPTRAKRQQWAALEARHYCAVVKNGICPHRGIDLRPFAKPDGTVICPAHGLAWDLTTGQQIQRFSMLEEQP